jgi:hypothetical protein
MPIPEGQILLGTVIGNAPNAPGYWVTPSNFPKDLHNIHGHVFAVDTDVDNRGHLLPAEFREGPPESIENVDSGFFKAFIDYLQNNNLETIFGLEAIQGQHKKLVEFSFDVGNLLLEEGRVRMDIIAQEGGPFELQDTVWSVVAKDKIVQHTTGETRCVTFKTGHVRMTNSKVTMSGLDVLRILEDEGVLVI